MRASRPRGPSKPEETEGAAMGRREPMRWREPMRKTAGPRATQEARGC